MQVMQEQRQEREVNRTAAVSEGNVEVELDEKRRQELVYKGTG